MKVNIDVHPAHPEDGIKVSIRVKHEPIDQKLIEDRLIACLVEKINDARRGHGDGAEPPADRSYAPLYQHILLELIDVRANDLGADAGAINQLTNYLYTSKGLIKWPPNSQK